MAVTGDWQHAIDAAERQRRQQAFQAAARHSRRVRRLRLALPAIGASAIFGIIVMSRLGLPDELDLSVAQLSVTRNAIIMDKPRLTGFDADQRAYTVSADRAVQALANPQAVQLEKIEAELRVVGQGTTWVRAAAGDYDNAAGKLQLRGGIALESSEGYALEMQSADIDFKAGSMSSPHPVRATYRGSETVGRSMAVSRGGRVIVLEGDVRTLLLPPKSAAAGGGTPEPAALGQ